MFRGREMAHTELGRKLLDRLSEDLKELATVDTFPKLDGRNMVMVMAPLKRPAVKLAPELPREPREPREQKDPGAGDRGVETARAEPVPAEVGQPQTAEAAGEA
jgi:translation initiation factor IF-3